MSDFKCALKWYKSEVVNSQDEKVIKLHTQMWSEWLSEMKIPHLLNTETFTFSDKVGSDIRFTPSIIVPEVELFFASEEAQSDAECGDLYYPTQVPLFLYFDPVSLAYCEIAPRMLSPDGYAEISFPKLPCRDEMDDYDLVQHYSVGSYLLNDHSPVVRFGNSFNKIPLYFVCLEQYQTPLKEQIAKRLFGRSFLVPFEQMLAGLSIYNGVSGHFALDLGTEFANRVLYKYYEQYGNK